MKIPIHSLTGSKETEIELPNVFSTPFRNELIHKAYVNLDSHHFQKLDQFLLLYLKVP